MDDNEARYLIDQYNKYASWSERPYEVGATVFVLFLAILALFLSLTSLDSKMSYLVIWLWGSAGLAWLTWGSAAAVAALFLVFCVVISRMYGGHERRLLALEGYRFKHKLLPDGITFKTIIESNPEQLEKLLKENWPAKPKPP